MLLPDADRDGLPDAWEVANGLNTNNVADALLDSDGDGQNNLHEYIAGTDPWDPKSFLKVEWMDGESGTALRCQAVSNRTYALLWRDELGSGSEGWLPWTNLVARPTNRLEILRAGPAPTNRFYRLRIPAQP
jgi:hypothetical protein